MPHATEHCPFCRPDAMLLQNGLAYVLEDRFPVNPGHLLLIPHRHVADFFQLDAAEQTALLELLQQGKAYLDRQYQPAGYNIGVNVGEVAGQTIGHVHVHLIPRYHGDTPNPRGGVRGVIPARQAY